MERPIRPDKCALHRESITCTVVSTICSVMSRCVTRRTCVGEMAYPKIPDSLNFATRPWDEQGDMTENKIILVSTGSISRTKCFLDSASAIRLACRWRRN